MTIRTRRVLVIVGSVVVLLCGATFAFIGGAALSSVLEHLVPPGAPGANMNPKVHLDAFWRAAFLGISAASALSFVYLFWARRPTQRSIQFAYCMALAVLLPISAVNYSTGDALMHRWAQALLDVVLVFVGLVTSLYLVRIRPTSAQGAALQSIILFILVLQTILMPGVYAVIFLANLEGLIRLAQTRDLSPGWATLASSVGAATAAVANFVRTRSGSPTEPPGGE